MALSTPYILAMVLLSMPVAVLAADQVPGSKDPTEPPFSHNPPLAPPVPPSKIDPGIQKQPDTVPNPKAIVPPPVVDPNMVVDPEKPRPGDNVPAPKTDGSTQPKR